MKSKVLLVAYHFPPYGGAAAQRVVQLVRRLPALGYEPVVLTGPGTTQYRWTPADPRVLDELRDVAVHRLPAPEPPRHGAWNGRLERWLGVPAKWQHWWADGVQRAAADLISDVDLVHASVAPFATARSLRELSNLGVPLVLDLEDPWALDEMVAYPTRLHRRLERRRMRRTLAVGDAVVMSTLEAARRVERAFPEIPAARVSAIPNAFDAADFERPIAFDHNGAFRIVHTGSLHTDLGLRQRRAPLLRSALGGAAPGVDFLTRSHVFLQEALSIVAKTRPDLVASVQLHFAGVLTETDLRVAEAAVVPVKIHGFLSHSETMGLIRSADLLFLPLHDVPPPQRTSIVPQKTYEYVGSGRPILAAVPNGDARDLLSSCGTAAICNPSDAHAMVEIVIEHVERWQRGASPPQPSRTARRYDSERLARDVATLYDAVLRRQDGTLDGRRHRARSGERNVAVALRR